MIPLCYESILREQLSIILTRSLITIFKEQIGGFKGGADEIGIRTKV